jgi:excisionase family DNA binding protein
MVEKLLVSVPEAAVILGVSDETVWAWIYSKRIESVKIGRLRKIRLSEIERFMKENTVHRAE